MSTYALRPDDQPIIDAAVAVGDLLVSAGLADADQTRDIRRLQEALRRLPATVQDGDLDMEYALTAYEGSSVIDARLGKAPWRDAGGRIRSWGVALSGWGLAIYSVYTPVPADSHVGDPAELELDFFLTPGDKPHVGTCNFERFVAEVQALPGLLIRPDVRVEAAVRGGPAQGQDGLPGQAG